MRPVHVAIVGAGPSGFFAAAALLRAADEIDVRVDMLEMLPTPWGLVRSGVAPDHPKIKSVSQQFEKTAENPRFRFFGNVRVGEHVEVAELAEHYDAVIYAIGRNPTGPSASPASSCRAASPPSISSAGTTRIRTSSSCRLICPGAGPWSSATATSLSTSPACS